MIKELAALALVALLTVGLGTSLFAGHASAPSTTCHTGDCI